MNKYYLQLIEFIKSSNSKYILGFVSFIESIFFPLPPDALLIPMVLSQKFKWFRLAFITTIFSVAGGVVGYYLGNILFNEINSYIIDYGYMDDFNYAQMIFLEYGVIILFISGFTPVPYKVFTITAGFLSVNIFMFVIVSFLGRGLRFYLVGYLTNKYKNNINYYLNKYLWQSLIFIVLLFIFYKFARLYM